MNVLKTDDTLIVSKRGRLSRCETFWAKPGRADCGGPQSSRGASRHRSPQRKPLSLNIEWPVCGVCGGSLTVTRELEGKLHACV